MLTNGDGDLFPCGRTVRLEVTKKPSFISPAILFLQPVQLLEVFVCQDTIDVLPEWFVDVIDVLSASVYLIVFWLGLQIKLHGSFSK